MGIRPAITFDGGADPADVMSAVSLFHVAKISGAFTDKALLADLRDIVEMTDQFIVGNNAPAEGSVKLEVMSRFSEPERTRFLPSIPLQEIPFAVSAVKTLFGTSSLMSALVEGRNNFHTCWARPEQRANTERKTEWLWHQDRYFHRDDDLTIWIPLSDCGEDAPSVEFLVRESDEILLADEMAAWAISPQALSSIEAECFRYTPKFVPGDCIVFDGAAIHRTHGTPEMKKARTSIDVRVARGEALRRRKKKEKWYRSFVRQFRSAPDTQSPVRPA